MSQLEFSRQEIQEAVRTARLLALEIELGVGRVPRCPHCYVPRRTSPGDELSEEEIRDVVLQAKDLGARRITILDGDLEPHRRLPTIARFAISQGLDVEVFTSGAGITAELARELFEAGVPVVLRMDSLDRRTQDALTGAEGSFELIQRAFQELKEAGYPGEEGSLRVDTLICRENLDEIVGLWRRLRSQDIGSRFEIAGPRPNAGEKGWPHVDPAEVREVFAEIAEIERSQYGGDWNPPPPRWGNGCTRHRYCCVVGSQGDVLPCVGVTISIGNVRSRRLGEIIRDSEILEDLRDHTRTMKGPCAPCEEAATCYGCRGAAYQLTGDYLASDPYCWRNTERQQEIPRLPFAAEGVVPQGLPMRIVDAVVRVGDRSGEVRATVSAGMPFVGEDGVVDGAMYFELMAQSIAALNGFKQLGGSQEPSGGYLVGAQNLEILGPARVGDVLTISVYKDLRFGGFGVVKGTVSRNDTVLARGEIKIWREAEDVSRPGDPGE
jgi:radical SAM protein with 4Fe4S-binding SPASM domain